ncbi:hypothetical protein TCAL_05902 [Tigriopus californicus]|uniref:DUF547 domain-containing protein n=2 Tax=Tigriopus californicus TaxID=6832 RepID=A0A553PPI9_TIGCA|nr:hypothetical protein TCAL_05902 [Tigriopus californicus]|eukprot:TCALIF_05902-PA protein Name:"Protein of unknown function" AED:0.00 eAED:0.00 QI:233/0/0.5/1/0/0.5/2/219/275
MTEEDPWVLNATLSNSDTVPDTQGLVAQMNAVIMELKSNFISESGVNYAAMAKDPAFQTYLNLARQLSRIAVEKLPEHERKAFFINLYNCMTIHILVWKHKESLSPKDIDGMWNKYVYQIGPHRMTLDEIEHGVLRSNRGHPAAKKPSFPEGDPRLSLVISTFDGRIHFALNCGARSCPPIRIYKAEKLDTQLEMAAKSFCSQEIRFAAESNTVFLSKLFLWYRNDFGSTDHEAVKCLAQYVTNATLQCQLRAIGGETKIVFNDYDWDANSSTSQ